MYEKYSWVFRPPYIRSLSEVYVPLRDATKTQLCQAAFSSPGVCKQVVICTGAFLGIFISEGITSTIRISETPVVWVLNDFLSLLMLYGAQTSFWYASTRRVSLQNKINRSSSESEHPHIHCWRCVQKACQYAFISALLHKKSSFNENTHLFRTL